MREENPVILINIDDNLSESVGHNRTVWGSGRTYDRSRGLTRWRDFAGGAVSREVFSIYKLEGYKPLSQQALRSFSCLPRAYIVSNSVLIF